ncbi:hypothetical protein CP973_15990 [Streptomyces albofaciens JCM 4342]|uniref:hypothetical protein n=1 Tax=Streptomyces albofaciens TaxID=66866 RepID=UPI0012389982|nr:hypothetical protein [Streptomyces albofaciens]KAA6223211.1 hypothetical protein CP973_15990 [Streptomyces albofaciens JCM 4342]
MGAFLALLVLLAVPVVFLADRVLLAMEARGWIYWRKTKRLSSIGADLVQEGSPGAQAVKRAMEQERVRKNVRPAQDPPVRVDLDTGTVHIRRTGHNGQEQAPPR